MGTVNSLTRKGYGFIRRRQPKRCILLLFYQALLDGFRPLPESQAMTFEIHAKRNQKASRKT